MLYTKKKIVLVHGLWNNPYLFKGLLASLEKYDVSIISPHLPHKYGRICLTTLANELDYQIYNCFGSTSNLQVLGFSMGGLIARYWIQNMQGHLRTDKYIGVGVPNQGSYLAQPVPGSLFQGIADMKRGSDFLRRLNSDLDTLKDISCISIFTRYDLMVIPGWEACLPIGKNISLPLLSHKALIKNEKSISLLSELIINDNL